MEMFHSLKGIKILLILSVILSFTNCECDETIKLKDYFNKTYLFELDFNVSVLEDYSTNYIKIEVESLYNSEIAISYYQKDSKFQERKQLSHSFSNTTFMWLN